MIWWTMFPSLLSAIYSYVGCVHSIIDNVHSAYAKNAGGVRPAISLRYGVEIKSGNGTADRPYIIDAPILDSN